MNRFLSLLIVLMVFVPLTGRAQCSIDSCYVKAERTYPQIAQYGLLEQIKDYSLKNASMGYVPQFALSAKATYQTEVTEIPISMPGVTFKGLPKDQYQAILALNQTIWDGGVIYSKRKNIEAQYEVNSKSVEVDLYALRDRVNNLFFGIVLINEQLKQNVLFDEVLKLNYDKVASYVSNGLANQADLDAVRLEIVNNKQQRATLLSNRRAYLAMLSVMIGEQLDEEEEFITPDVDDYNPVLTDIKRPELGLFDANVNLLDAQRRSISSMVKPNIGLFVNGGVGNPGLNFLKAGFSPYAQMGINLSWNIGGFYTFGRERKIVDVNKLNVETSRQTFLFNTNIQVVQQGEEIKQIKELMVDDDLIIDLRDNVKKASEVKMENGIITVTDYLRDVNSWQMAIQSKTLHEVQLMMAVYKFKVITNN